MVSFDHSHDDQRVSQKDVKEAVRIALSKFEPMIYDKLLEEVADEIHRHLDVCHHVSSYAVGWALMNIASSIVTASVGHAFLLANTEIRDTNKKMVAEVSQLFADWNQRLIDERGAA